LRQADLADLETVLEFIREYYQFDEIEFDDNDIRRGLEPLLTDPNLGRIYFIEHAGKIAGYLSLTFGYDVEFGGRQAAVTDMYLRSEFRRIGLGTAALIALEKASLALGVTALELQAERDNLEARAFYAKLGFYSHDRIPMSKRLTPTSED
jgi:diamine N-acetyltransferase